MPHLHRRVRGFPGSLLTLTLLFCLGTPPPRLSGAEDSRRPFAIGTGVAEATLEMFSEQADAPVVFPLNDVRGVVTNPVQGRFTVRDALERLVQGTGLEVVRDERTGALVVKRGRPPTPPAETAGAGPSPALNPPTSSPMKIKKPLATLGAWLALALGGGSSGHAADAPAGTIEGRVQNARNGDSMGRVRLTVAGAGLETFSDADGHYRLHPVPTGTVQVRVFSTGFEPQTDSVIVTPGARVQRDYTFGTDPSAAGSGVVKLSQFVVGASRELDGTAIAINEQRFAPNIKNVLSTEEFGFVAEGNLAEFLKFVPGVTVTYVGGNAREISIEGVPAANIPINIDGFSIGTARTSTDTSRAVELDMVSTNSASRIEVTYSPTPESEGAALSGSVNMVTRSAFERVRPVFNGSIYVMMRDNARDFRKTPYVFERTRKVHPGFDFSYIAPVNKRFGFTLSGGHSTQFTVGDLSANAWRAVAAPTNGTTFPHTTPDRPYLSQYQVRPEPKTVERNSVGATVDYKVTANSRVSLSLLYSSYATTLNGNTLTFDVNRVLPDFTPTSTHGFAGAGGLTNASQVRHRFNRTVMPSLVWRQTGAVWKLEAGAGVARQTDRQPDLDQGRFLNVSSRRTGVTVSFDDIFYLRPRVITVTDAATGAAVDPNRLGNYALVSGTSNSNWGHDLKISAQANARRDFHGPVPFALKGGVDFRKSIRDVNAQSRTFTYVGPDGRATTVPSEGDDQAAPFADPVFAEMVAPFGFGHVERVDNRKLWQLYRDRPAYFTTSANNEYRSAVMASKRAEESVSAAYIRGDLQLIDRKLKLIGGLRAEQTNIEAVGPLSDPTGNFQRDAAGRFILGANGRPLAIATDPLAVSQRTLLLRAAHAEKEYLRLFPSLNASYHVRENLIARASYSESVGRPNFNQYAGGVTLPDTESPPSPGNRITVSNVGIKAWSARTVKVRFEYYFEGVGQIAVGAFRRDFENFFGSTVFRATPDFLSLYALDPGLYERYEIATQYNLASTVRMHGLDFNYKQALTFLPAWGRGLQVFANASAQRATGEASNNFAGYVPRSGSWGLSLTRERYNLRLNWSYTGRRRAGIIASGASIEPGTYNWRSKKMTLDVLGEFRVARRFALFASLRNVGDAPDDSEVAGPSTPPHAQLGQRLQFGSLWTFGLKGTF